MYYLLVTETVVTGSNKRILTFETVSSMVNVEQYEEGRPVIF